jgi:hypothetical protein
MEREMVYRLEHLLPPQDEGLGRYGFCAYLSTSFAERAVRMELGHEVQTRFQERSKDIIVKRIYGDRYVKDPFMFVEGTLLVQSFHVPGDACSLGVDWHGIDRARKGDGKFRSDLEYGPHNVDGMKQAFALASLFTYYIECAEASLDRM